MIAVTRRYRFAAAHVLRSPAFSDAENARVYGKCANPNGHGHDYGLEVTVSGEPDAVTGQLVDPAVLDALVRERVLNDMSDSLLNELPAFRRLVPTAENIARVAHESLEAALARAGAKLVRVRVAETRRNWFDYGDAE